MIRRFLEEKTIFHPVAITGIQLLLVLTAIYVGLIIFAVVKHEFFDSEPQTTSVSP